MAYESGTKFISVGTLRQLLATLPDHWEIECNRVGNLSLYDGPGNWQGYIDLGTEMVQLKEDNHGT